MGRTRAPANARTPGPDSGQKPYLLGPSLMCPNPSLSSVHLTVPERSCVWPEDRAGQTWAAVMGTQSFTGSRTPSGIPLGGQPGLGPTPDQRGRPESILDARGLAWGPPGQGEPQHPHQWGRGVPPAGPRRDAEHSRALFQPTPSMAMQTLCEWCCCGILRRFYK